MREYAVDYIGSILQRAFSREAIDGWTGNGGKSMSNERKDAKLLNEGVGGNGKVPDKGAFKIMGSGVTDSKPEESNKPPEPIIEHTNQIEELRITKAQQELYQKRLAVSGDGLARQAEYPTREEAVGYLDSKGTRAIGPESPVSRAASPAMPYFPPAVSLGSATHPRPGYEERTKPPVVLPTEPKTQPSVKTGALPVIPARPKVKVGPWIIGGGVGVLLLGLGVGSLVLEANNNIDVVPGWPPEPQPEVAPAIGPITELSPLPTVTSTETDVPPTLRPTTAPTRTPRHTPTYRPTPISTVESVTLPESVEGQLLYVEKTSTGDFFLVNDNNRWDLRYTGTGRLSSPAAKAYISGLIEQTMRDRNLPEFWNQENPPEMNGDVFFVLDEAPTTEQLSFSGSTEIDMILDTGFVSTIDVDENGRPYIYISMLIDEDGNLVLKYAVNGYPVGMYEYLKQKYHLTDQEAASLLTSAGVFDTLTVAREVARNNGRPLPNTGGIFAGGTIDGSPGGFTPLEDPPGNLEDVFTEETRNNPDFLFEGDVPVLP